MHEWTFLQLASRSTTDLQSLSIYYEPTRDRTVQPKKRNNKERASSQRQSTNTTHPPIIPSLNTPQYLGTYLLSYVKGKEAEATRLANQAKLQGLLSEEAEKKTSLATASAKLDSIQKSKEEEETQIAANLPAIDPVLTMLLDRTKASAVYYGRKETTAGGGTQIQYLKSTQTSVIGKVLKGGDEGEEPDEVGTYASSEGATWPLFQSKEEEETTPNPVEGEDDIVTIKTVYPPSVTVSNVIRDSTVKCFAQIPKLGSYLAVPVRYSSCLWDGGIGDAPPPAEPDAAVEGEAPADPAAEPAAEPSKYAPVTQMKECIIALDTCGQGRLFTATERTFAEDWGVKVSTSLEADEGKRWLDDIKRLEEMAAGESALAAEIEAAVAAGAAFGGDKVAALPEGSGEEVKALADAAGKLEAAYSAAEVGRNTIGVVGMQCNIPPRAEVLTVLSTALSICGDLGGGHTDPLNGKQDWSLIRQNAGESMWAKMKAFEPASLAASRVEALKAGLESLDPSTIAWGHVNPQCAGVGAILKWCQAAIANSEAYAALKDKEEETRLADEAAAAEAAAAEADAAAAAAEAEEE
jgi:hypothetical protein